VAQKETHDKLAARKEQARAAATSAVEKVDQQLKSINDSTSQRWTAIRAYITAASMRIRRASAQRP